MEAKNDGRGEKYTLANLKEVPLSGDDNLCWRGLFDSAIIAVGPEIRKPLQNIRGLELNFNVMLQLSAVEYPVLVDSGLVLIGYSTALIPIRKTEDGMIMWHLEVAKNDFQIKIADIEAIKDPKTWLRVEDLDKLRSHRALLGWCSASNILLGTDRLAMDVTWSNAKIKATSWHWKGANLQLLAQSSAPLQIGGQAGMSFDRTINTIQFSPSGNYLKCLRSSALVPIVLYDVTSKRAWLVSLLSVLHHMLLVYCDTIDEGLRGAKAPIAKNDGSNGSLEALSGSGGKTVEKSGQDALTIRELIMGFSVNLSKASLQKPKKSTIYGYEFMDIVMDSTRSELKKTTLEKEGLAWTSLLNEVNCLFCSNLGDAIVGRIKCDDFPSCNTLPPSLDYMAASVQSLKALSKRHGGHIDGEATRLSQSCYLQLTGSPFQSHHGHADPCWENVDFLQEIQTSQPANKTRHQSLDKYSSGALVFGKAVRTKAERMHDWRGSQVDVDSVVEEKNFKKHIMFVRSD
ncbi:hypothetical protein N7478_013148 [Penicillium angulare]|uniref:uncharacterized protein n=1 Tax=Penicillium angulare TaxID=116970 RepID=UPI0025416C7D|nr:uncharacterized protein N7478_013148 [Penicillium angulare]KAJ5257044.1 hypothetical protein N7478_013148 [Penicillium angulare]